MLPLFNPGQIEVLDGDTIRVAGETFRLVGFDAPETYRARCPSEHELGNRATSRDFSSSWPEETSILSGSHVPAAPARKEHLAATMAVRAVS